MKINKKTVFLAVFSISTLLTGVGSAYAADINVRQTIGNSGLNKIGSARLSGMFADAPEQTVESDKQFGRRGCVTSIGNQTSGTSLMGKPQDVNILGDVTNVCF